MAKKGRRRKRKKQNNVIQFPGGSAALDESKADAGEDVAAKADQVAEAADAVAEKVDGVGTAAAAVATAAAVKAAETAKTAAAKAAETAKTVVDMAAPDAIEDEGAGDDPSSANDDVEERAKAEAAAKPKNKKTKKKRDHADVDSPKSKSKSKSKSDDDKGKRASGKSASKSAGAKGKNKKAKTTSSQMIRAITASGEHAAVEAAFFSANEDKTRELEPETWADIADDGTRAYEARWRKITLAIGALGVSGIIAALVYVNYFAVRPAETNRRRGAEAPTKIVVTPTPTEESPSTTSTTTATATANPLMAAAVPPTEEPSVEEATTTAEAPAVEEATEAAVAEAGVAEAAAAEAAAEAAAAEAAAEAAVAEAAETPVEATAAEEVTEAAAVEPPAEADGETYESVLADAQRARGRSQLALYRRAIELNPNGVEALTFVAFRQLNRGRYAEARDLSSRATTNDPTVSKAWVTLGAASEALRDRTAAHQAYSSCVEQATGRLVAECRRGARRTQPR